MRTVVLSLHPGLAQSSRLPVLSGRQQGLQVVEMLLLVGAGVGAALATALFDYGLRIPGHAIIRVVFPMSLGLALAPRRMGGMVMGASALGSALMIQAGGLVAFGAGAITSLALTGPALDLALWRCGRSADPTTSSRRGQRAAPNWGLYLGFALAGLGSNLAALAVRAGTKLAGLDRVGGRPLADWWPQAVGSYAVCGLLAGLLSAVVWFQFVAGDRRSADSEPLQ
jgi:hypothetical protein